MNGLDEHLVSAALELRDALLSAGMEDKAFRVNAALARAQNNLSLEQRTGDEIISKVVAAKKNICDRCGEILSQPSASNSDLLAVAEDSLEDMAVLRDHAADCPDFIFRPAAVITSGVSRAIRRIEGGRPSDRLNEGVLGILQRMLKEVREE